MYFIELKNNINISLLPQLNDLGTYYYNFLTSGGGDNTTYKIVIIIRDKITMELPETLPRELLDIFDSRYPAIKFNYNSVYGEKIDYLEFLESLARYNGDIKLIVDLNKSTLNNIVKDSNDFLQVYEEWADYRNKKVTSETISSLIFEHKQDIFEHKQDINKLVYNIYMYIYH